MNLYIFSIFLQYGYIRNIRIYFIDIPDRHIHRFGITNNYVKEDSQNPEMGGNIVYYILL